MLLRARSHIKHFFMLALFVVPLVIPFVFGCRLFGQWPDGDAREQSDLGQRQAQ
jgi:hypothetical protein